MRVSNEFCAPARKNTVKAKIWDQCDMLAMVSDSMVQKSRPSYLKIPHIPTRIGDESARHQLSLDGVGRNVVCAAKLGTKANE